MPGNAFDTRTNGSGCFQKWGWGGGGVTVGNLKIRHCGFNSFGELNLAL